jgi:hypothetical protein
MVLQPSLSNISLSESHKPDLEIVETISSLSYLALNISHRLAGNAIQYPTPTITATNTAGSSTNSLYAVP